jgi:5-hydroxyisourate hydrolase
MSQITTHVLDTARGRPAAGIALALERGGAEGWSGIALAVTNADGRVMDLLPDGHVLEPGVYRLRFETEPYFRGQGVDTFYPSVEIPFFIRDAAHYHVPLLLSPFGFTTYRGS